MFWIQKARQLFTILTIEDFEDFVLRTVVTVVKVVNFHPKWKSCRLLLSFPHGKFITLHYEKAKDIIPRPTENSPIQHIFQPQPLSSSTFSLSSIHHQNLPISPLPKSLHSAL